MTAVATDRLIAFRSLVQTIRRACKSRWAIWVSALAILAGRASSRGSVFWCARGRGTFAFERAGVLAMTESFERAVKGERTWTVPPRTMTLIRVLQTADDPDTLDAAYALLMPRLREHVEHEMRAVADLHR